MAGNKTVSVILAAAGNSTRLGEKWENASKQFILLNEKPLLYFSLEKFALLENILEIIVVTNDLKITNDLVAKYKMPVNMKIKVTLGGNLRQDSVYRGFCEVDPSCDLVLIHDIARPLFDIKDARACIEEAAINGAAILAVSLVDTIKKSKYDNDELIVDKTIERNGLYQIQTPQVFSYDLLLDVYRRFSNTDTVLTDEAMMMEIMEKRVSIVSGSRKNIKITYPEDLEIASLILNKEVGADCMSAQ